MCRVKMILWESQVWRVLEAACITEHTSWSYRLQQLLTDPLLLRGRTFNWEDLLILSYWLTSQLARCLRVSLPSGLLLDCIENRVPFFENSGRMSLSWTVESKIICDVRHQARVVCFMSFRWLHGHDLLLQCEQAVWLHCLSKLCPFICDHNALLGLLLDQDRGFFSQDLCRVCSAEFPDLQRDETTDFSKALPSSNQ